MGEILKIATNVATPLALLGLVAALAYFTYSRRLKHAEKRLESLPEAERARITDEHLTRYGIDGSRLRLADKFALIRDEMDRRHRRSQTYLIVSAVVFVVCFGLAVIAYVSKNGAQAAPSGPVDVSRARIGSGPLAQAFSFLAGKNTDYAGMDAQMPHLDELITEKRASGQYLCSSPVDREWTNPTVTVHGIRAGRHSPTVEAHLFAPRGERELQLKQSTRDIRNGEATLKFQGTLPERGVVFVACWVEGPAADLEWSELSITLR